MEEDTEAMEETMNIILIGKTGTGKSVTVNCIMREFFSKTQNNLLSRNVDVSKPIIEHCEIDGGKYSFIDGLDIYECARNADFSNAEEAVKLSRDGIDIFLFEINSEDGFGEEHQKAVDVTRKIFGNKVFKTYGILVLICDYDKTNVLENSMKVEEWFEQQTGQLKDLYEECNKRCALIENVNRKYNRKKDQVRKLTSIFQNLRVTNKKKYTFIKFMNNDKLRNKLKLKMISYKMNAECDDLINKIREDINISENTKETIKLEDAKLKLKEFKRYIDSTLGNHSKLSIDMIAKMKSFDMEIERKIKSVLENNGQKTVSSKNKEPFLNKANVMTEETRKSIQGVPVITLPASQILIEGNKLIPFADQTEHITAKTKKTNNVSVNEDSKEKANSYPINAPYKKPKLESDDRDNGDKIDNFLISEQQKQVKISNEMTFLLMGNAGNGKSATGNTILGGQVFQTTANTSVSRSSFKRESTLIGSMIVTVVDGPGVNTALGPGSIFEHFNDSVKEALDICDYSFTSLLIVLKYGTRFTKEESECIKLIKGILGNDVLKKYGVCVVTHGDSFDYDFEGENKTFIVWCSEQEGEIKQLFQDCNYRCVLLNNKNKDQRETHVNKLLDLVSPDSRYSYEEFQFASTDRQKIMVEYELPKILEETENFLSDKRKQLKKLETFGSKTSQIENMENMLKELKCYIDGIFEKYGNHEILIRPISLINVLSLEIQSKIKLVSNVDQLAVGYSACSSRCQDAYQTADKGAYEEILNAIKGIKTSVEDLDLDLDTKEKLFHMAKKQYDCKINTLNQAQRERMENEISVLIEGLTDKNEATKSRNSKTFDSCTLI